MNSKKYLKYLGYFCSGLVAFALGTLFIRSLVWFYPYGDSLSYHLPIALHRAGLDVSFELDEFYSKIYYGFPFLAEFIQGLLWRLFGTINATSAVNLIGLLLFISFCHFKLRAKFWLTSMIALTAPLVIIHSTSGYVDLFAGSFLAISISSLIYAHFNNKESDRTLLFWGMAGLIGALWSKKVLLPISLLVFVIYAIRTVYIGIKVKEKKIQIIKTLSIIFVCAVLAGTPYLKNIIFYGNPVYPYNIPVETLLKMETTDKPTELKKESQFTLFIHSLFEINQPTDYNNRLRWTIDQGQTSQGFRLGGFWNISVIIFLLSLFLIPFILNRRKAVPFAAVTTIFLLFISLSPQSHELRYSLYIPLSWSAAIAIFFNKLKEKHSLLSCGLIALYLGLFLYMVKENWYDYKVTHKSFYTNAVDQYDIPAIWKEMKTDQNYCAVDISKISLLLTGPTLKEFNIINRRKRELCPDKSLIITGKLNGYLPFLESGSPILHHNAYLNMGDSYYKILDYKNSIDAYKNVISINPNNKEVLNNICSAYNHLNKWADAIHYCREALKIDPTFSLPKNNIAFAINKLKKVNPNFDKIDSSINKNQDYLTLGSTLYNQAQFEAAIGAFKKIKPKDAETLNNICASYNNLKKWNEAIKYCNLALGVNPNFDLAKNNLTYSLNQKNKLP